MKHEIIATATAWAIGGALGQLALIPFGAANWSVWFGLVVGATCQTAVHCCLDKQSNRREP